MNKLWNKYKEMSKQAKAAIWFVVCSVLQKGVSFITVPIFADILTTEEYGTYSLYSSWMSLLTIITSLYLFNGVLNNAMVKYKDDRDRYISSMQGLTVTITMLIFAIFLIFEKKWEMLFGLAPIYIIMMFIEAFVTPSLHYWSGKQRFEYKYKKLVAVTLAKTVANPLLGIIAVHCASDKAFARVLSVVVVEFVFCGIIFIIQFYRGKVFFDRTYWKYALVMGMPLLPHYLSGLILNQADRIMIEKMVGRSEVAFYSVSYNVGMLVQIFSVAIGNALTPWMYQKIKSKDCKGVGKTIDLLLLMISAIAFSLMLCSPEVIAIIGSSKYDEAVYVIPPVAASVFFIFLYNLLAIPQFYYEKTKFMLFASIFAAIMNLGLNWIFIGMFGYVAAGYTTLACYIIYSIGHYIISTNLMKKENSEMADEIFDKKIIFILSFVTVVLGVACNFIFDYIILRYTILLICFVIAFIKRKQIIGLVKEIKRK
ncbi:MAG: oligosaccharide flippase family protein [Eubacterium sp.]|nr:oligosaccharide flippase family protein [Eubacterium sp.]